MTKKKILIMGIGLLAVGSVAALGITLYMFYMPHRDVQTSKTDYIVEASQLVSEYLIDAKVADQKYLDEEGESKILEITGVVASISEDFINQKVVLLKAEGNKAGVSCTFSELSNHEVDDIKQGQLVTIKGVIRSGASFDVDLGLYEDVIVEKSALVKK